MNPERIINIITEQLSDYLVSNNLKSMVLGISGGIDSTVVACLCHIVNLKTNIPLIGVSLPSATNSKIENTIASKVMKNICNRYYTYNIQSSVNKLINLLYISKKEKIRIGNIKARTRMTILMDIASSSNGVLIGTDNKTEHTLGFYTIFGDQGIIEPIIDLYKSDVYEIALYLENEFPKFSSILDLSMRQEPTDGNGCNTDAEQIGADYFVIDSILKGKTNNIDEKIINKINERVAKNKFKSQIPIKFYLD